MKPSRLTGAACAGLLSISMTPLHAAITQYEYVGVPFEFADGTVYQTGQKVTATIRLASELATGQSTPTPISFSLYDDNAQNEYITNLNATSSNFWFDTNASGDIVRWQFGAERLGYPTIDTGHQIYAQHLDNYTFEYGYGLADDGSQWVPAVGGEYYNDTALALYGTWTVTTVPVPATALLFGSGLFGLTGVVRRRKAP
jgi:hypothetical protein